VNCLGVGAITSVTDSKGNGWSSARPAAGIGTVRAEVWGSLLGTALVSGDTIVLHTTGATDTYAASVDEFSGFTGPGFTVDNSAVRDAAIAGGLVGPASITTIAASTVVICVIGSSSADVIDFVATGMTAGFTYTASAKPHYEWMVRTTTGTISSNTGGPAYTSGTGNESIVMVAIRTVAGGGGAPPTPRRRLAWQMLRPGRLLGGFAYRNLRRQAFRFQTPSPPATTAAIQVGLALAISWRIRTTVGLAKSFSWRIRALVGLARAASWRIRTTVGLGRALSWRLHTTVGLSETDAWRLRGSVGKALASTWRIRVAVGSAKTFSYRIRSTVVAARAASWRIRQTVVGSRVLSWRVRAVASATQLSTWRIHAKVGPAVAAGWRILGNARVGRPLTLAWGIAGDAAAFVFPGGRPGRVIIVRPPATPEPSTPVAVRSELVLAWKVGSSVGSTLELHWQIHDTAGVPLRASWRLDDDWSANREVLLAEIDEDLLALSH
jgi:hypothetical protein